MTGYFRINQLQTFCSSATILMVCASDVNKRESEPEKTGKNTTKNSKTFYRQKMAGMVQCNILIVRTERENLADHALPAAAGNALTGHCCVDWAKEREK